VGYSFINPFYPVKYVDYYAALGLPRNADLTQIKKAYRTLARQHHPDISKAPGTEEKFKNIAVAYATLKDPEKRASYDRLERLRDGAEMPPSWQGGPAQEYDTPDFGGMDLSDFLSAMGRNQGFGGHAGTKEPGPLRGRDLEDTVLVTLEQALQGSTLRLVMEQGGNQREIEVTIPAGVHAGQKLRLRGKGEPGVRGGPDGDFYLHIAFTPHAVFRVDHHDLYFNLALTPWEAALGTQIGVRTLDSDVTLTVPPGTSSGKKVRLRGRGLPGAKATRGDMYALVHIEVPAVLTPDERKLLEELASVSTFNPRQRDKRSPP
jgi:curved DNA-binding protein